MSDINELLNKLRHPKKDETSWTKTIGAVFMIMILFIVFLIYFFPSTAKKIRRNLLIEVKDPKNALPVATDQGRHSRGHSGTSNNINSGRSANHRISPLVQPGAGTGLSSIERLPNADILNLALPLRKKKV